MRLRLYYNEGWRVQFVELNLSVPLAFIQLQEAVRSIEKLWPDADVTVDHPELRSQLKVVK